MSAPFNSFHLSFSTSAKLPTRFGNFEIMGCMDETHKKEHVVITLGKIDQQKNVLTRIHSQCLTGDTFGSLRCDCSKQLQKALKQIQKKGRGILIYLAQEGRGIGLINKIKAYSLQDQGLDTIEANKALGFEHDYRDYEIAAAILKQLKVNSIALPTNNPEKVTSLKKYGIAIEAVLPLRTRQTQYNKHYLHTKKYKIGHSL